MKSMLIALMLVAMLVCPALAMPEISSDNFPIVDGSTATLPLSYLLRERITGESPEQAVNMTRHNTTTVSVYNLVNRNADLLLVYKPQQEALSYAADCDIALDIAPIGRDALVFLTNAGNPVSTLTGEQIIDIYTGKITSWSEVGGANLPIEAFQRDDASGSQVLMKALVMNGAPMMPAPSYKAPEEMGMLIDVVAEYENTANALGYSVYYYVRNMYALPEIKLLSVNGVAPSNESIGSGEYPYTQDFYCMIRADEPAYSPARIIFDWLKTDAGAALIEEAGYVSVK